MNKPLPTHLSRRESQIMDVVYRLGEASVSEVVNRIADTPAYNSIRVTLGILEKKGYLRHRQEGQRYIYTPVMSPETATRPKPSSPAPSLAVSFAFSVRLPVQPPPGSTKT